MRLGRLSGWRKLATKHRSFVTLGKIGGKGAFAAKSFKVC